MNVVMLLPTLSIVVVNSDGTEDTLRCIELIYANPPSASFEIVLVDNCSRIPCLPLVHERFPKVRTFSAPRRQGFARNYNLGIREANGAYVLILNNDTLVHQDALDRLISALRDHPEYGMVGPQIRGTNDRIQPACARPLISPRRYLWHILPADLGHPLGRLIEQIEIWRLERRQSGPVACIVGACMLVRRSDLDSLGALDEGYDFYYEDIEWCHRVWAQGRQVAYVAEARITHLGDQSLSKVKVWAKQSEYRSALRYFRQYYHISRRQEWMIWFVTALNFLLRGSIFLAQEAATGKMSYARAYFYLWSWVLCQRPASGGIAELLD